jgi:hypothetical protein
MTIATGLGAPPRRYTMHDLNRSHPLAFGLISYIFPGDTIGCVVTGRQWITSGGNSTIQSSPFGPANSWVYGVSVFTDTGPYPPICPGSAVGVTHAVLASPPADGNTYYMSQVGNGAGGDAYCDLLANVTASSGSQAGNFVTRLFGTNNVTSQACDAGGTTFTGTGYHMFAGSHSAPNVAHTYYDGVNTGASCLGTVTPGTASYTHQIAYCSFPVVLRACWSRALSDAEHLSFALNPWQVFYA